MGRRLLMALAAGTFGCELGEINVPPTDPIVVVQAVMRPDREFQWILVEQTLTGRTVEQGTVEIIPSNAPLQSPIRDASVFVSNISLTNDPCGRTVEFRQDPPPGEQTQTGVYWSPLNCPTMRPGDTLELRVEALDSVVSGRTEIPGFTQAVLRAGNAFVDVPHGQLEFNRDVDTLDASVQATHGRAIHVELHPVPATGPDSLREAQETGAWFWVDSTGLTLPGNLIDLFEGEFDTNGGSAPDLFVAGFEYTVTTAFMDRNLFDSFRSANFPLSGRGYISNLTGGFGLFGSLVAQPNNLRVIGNVDDPREGTYELSGVVQGALVDLELELYVGRQWIPGVLRSPFAAFARGTWLGSAFNRSVVGNLEPGGILDLFIPRGPGSDEGGWQIRGIWPESGPGRVVVFSPGAATDTLSVLKR